jgi:hypothetical protein
LAALPLFVLQRLLGARFSLGLVLAVIAFCVLASAWSIASKWLDSAPARAALAVFALANPWVYTQVVAGHVPMLIAYAATAVIVAELVHGRYRQALIVPAAGLLITQIQFFLVAGTILFAFALRNRWKRVAIVLVAAALPIGTGILTSASSLSAIPRSSSWEYYQSVPIRQAALLRGYFAGYDAAFHWPQDIGLCIFAAAALIGFLTVRSAAGRLAGTAIACLLVAVSIFRGPLHDVAAAVYASLPPLSVFRELYDLLGFVALGYVVLAACAAARWRFLHYPIVLAALLLVLPWTGTLWQFWVAAEQLPTLDVPAPDNSRFAMLPALQPLVFLGRGSGVDPDQYARPSGRTPLNPYLIEYPTATALLTYAHDGSVEPLRRLGVRWVFTRPQYSSDYVLLNKQAPSDSALPEHLQSGSRREISGSWPLLGISKDAPTAAFVPEIGDGTVFFADAEERRKSNAFSPVTAPPIDIDSSRAWVSAQLLFSSTPGLGQPFGGAATRSAGTWLPVPAGPRILAFARGRLIGDDNHVILADTDSYEWTALRAGVQAVRCEGLCVVLGTGDPAGFALTRPGAVIAPEPLSFTRPFPWLLIAKAPAASGEVLRFNERFDRSWFAFVGSTPLRHLRIDHLTNGWRLPDVPTAGDVILIERRAATQALLEIVAGLLVLVLAFGPSARRQA